jgi:gamma-glutamyl-gamma-aminobutyrate hydrolase PuuD
MPAVVLPQAYVEAVQAAGAVPIVLPPTPQGSATPHTVLDAVHGLVLSGGPDLGTGVYGADTTHAETGPADARRDAFELAIVRTALRRRMPLLAICRGMQLLNAARGGDLVQHLGDVVELEPHRQRPGVFGSHAVTVEPGSRVAELLDDGAPVCSHHHQGVGRVGDGLVVAARAHDGTVEAIEDPSQPFCIGVLWHPEEQRAAQGAALFAALVEAAHGYIERREQVPA